MLVAAVVGLETRATLDIDTTVKSLPLTMETARRVVEDVIRTDVPDGVSFTITKVSDIMEGHDYPGIRFILEASLDKMKQAIKVDISTGDIITPGAVEYSYKLMFEDRSISIWTYNLETLLGEKLETIMARETANTRMRDFYDIHILMSRKAVDYKLLKSAFLATSEKRATTALVPRFGAILEEVRTDKTMESLWEKYRKENFFVGDLTWEDVNQSLKKLKETLFDS